MINVYFDGSCGPKNPGGTAAYGFIVKDDQGDAIHFDSGRVCQGEFATNNVAEFEALYQSMLWIASNHPKKEVTFNGDSTLVISQMKGDSRARSGKYLPYYHKTIALAMPFISKRLWRFNWIPRGLNSEADNLAQYHRY